jgi:hypothetical protein
MRIAMTKPDYKAQEKWVAKTAKKGLVRVNVWVPSANAEEVKLLASNMRQEFKLAMSEV